MAQGVALALALAACGGVKSAQAQDWTDYLHWPYVPPQVPGNGFEYNGLYDGWYRYPREQRIVPQIQGPYYRNYYGGYRVIGHLPPPAWLARLEQEEMVPGLPLHPRRLLKSLARARRASAGSKERLSAGPDIRQPRAVALVVLSLRGRAGPRRFDAVSEWPVRSQHHELRGSTRPSSTTIRK